MDFKHRCLDLVRPSLLLPCNGADEELMLGVVSTLPFSLVLVLLVLPAICTFFDGIFKLFLYFMRVSSVKTG